MSVIVLPAAHRFHGQHGWLESWHSFSFAEFLDPERMGFRSLRVINDDWIAPGQGFGTHPHRDMEIITYVYEGAVAHRDSTGAEGIVSQGEVQHMSAGQGIRHSEFNASPTAPLRLLQIWITPADRGLVPRYGQAIFDDEAKRDRLRLIASPRGRDGALRIAQDAEMFASLLSAGKSVAHPLAHGRGAWVQVVSGRLAVNGVPLAPGDGAAIEGAEHLDITATDQSEFVLFDLA